MTVIYAQLLITILEKKKINTLDFNKQKSILKQIGKKHEEETLKKWKKYIN